ncbi:FAD-dependent oxidoreductase [Orrella marina]|uniref:Pyridine nucleotide-disulfide oxidoreductase n=1 Tax=Orrella marina TaxID=2163011 RepID=A0A2R4XIX0_9BURK|nr:FAD-dependent oxidoreductase [Orrella marina]AWB33728.1 pyridine nucleotide-disulfide oxidoreductase [Orrella marina]
MAPLSSPPLSKHRTEATAELALPAVIPQSRYSELNIDLRLGTTATGINRHQHTLTIRNETDIEVIEYRKLLVTTGARATPLAITGADLPGVHYLRTYDDAQAIRQSASRCKRAIVIGGSFIGMEVAGTLRQQGLEVVIVERDTLLYKLHHSDVSTHFEAMLRKHGVECRLGQRPVRFEGKHHVSSVVLDTDEHLACDMIVIGAGVTPNVNWLLSSGIELQDGVRVNEYLQSSDPDIYAAGDVANAWHPVFRRQMRVEHWDNAGRQAKIAARNMAGEAEPYTHISYFFSHVFDQSYNVLGLTQEQCKRINRGALKKPPFEVLYLDQGVCEGFFTLGRASENTRAAETLIRDRVNLTRHFAKLKRASFALREVPGQVLFILQGGGAYGAFECGAIQALQEHGILPDLVAGVSIGAFNGAIIASNREHAAEALENFWRDVSTISPEFGDEATRRLIAGNQISTFGVPGFFSPRWMQSLTLRGPAPHKWTSLYDFSEAKELLEKYVDFPGLCNSPVRLLVTAVDIQTSDVVLFDSHVDQLSADHILASGSLPPAFDWTTIDGRHYWDAGIISNSPLEAVLQRVGSAGKQIYLIDLFTGKRAHMPENMMDVYSRREEIIFSERLRRDHNKQDLLMSHRRLIEQLMAQLSADKADRVRSEPLYQQLMGETAATQITRIMRESNPENPPSRAYDFSRPTVVKLIEDGYLTAKDVLQATKNRE